VAIEFGEGTEDYIVSVGYSPALGARELRRTVERLVQAPLSDMALSGRLKEHGKWQMVRTANGVSVVPLESS